MKIAVAGCKGRMGLELVRTIIALNPSYYAGGSIHQSEALPDADFWKAVGIAEACKASVVQSAEALVALADVVIDFTRPEYTLELAEHCAEHKKALVTGTTGLSKEQQMMLENFAKKTSILQGSNMSLGVMLVMKLVKEAAAKLDDDFDIEIVEMHHRNKVDAPSGTALSMGKAAAAGRGVDFDKVAVLSREGQTGIRPKGEIGFATLRGGDVIGDHSVVFAGQGERIEINHKSSSRGIYANGAVKAAIWLADKPPALYSMQDMLA